MPPARRHPGRGAAGPAHARSEGDGVGDGGAAGVVVEVDEHVLLVGPGLGQPVGPRLQRVEAIPPAVAPGVQSQVPPVGRAPQRRDRLLGAVGPAERRAVSLQQVTDVIGPPAGVPRFDGDAAAGRELGQAEAEQLGVGAQRGRQLQQDGVEPVAQPGRAVDQPRHRLAQPLDVGEGPAGLDRPPVVLRGAGTPGLERGALGQPVEGGVAVHRGEVLRVVLQPQPLRQPLRVEPAAPVAVLPSRRPDEHRHARGRSPVDAVRAGC